MNVESKIIRRENGKSHAGTDAAVHLAHDLIDRAAKHLETSEEKLRDTAVKAEKALKSSLSVVKSKGLQARTTTKSLVQQHPFATAGLALGLGLLIARMGRDRQPIEKPDVATKE